MFVVLVDSKMSDVYVLFWQEFVVGHLVARVLRKVLGAELEEKRCLFGYIFTTFSFLFIVLLVLLMLHVHSFIGKCCVVCV